ncbi:hypothetical protein AAG906_001728 [Vitis piasezkii]
MTMRPLLIETISTPAYCYLIGNVEDQVELPWSLDGMLLLCIDRATTDRVMREVHAGFSPKSSSGHEYILAAIDYFTKWVEPTSYANLTATKTNGVVEAANKNIKRILRKMVETSQNWVKPRKFQKGDLVLRVLKGLINDPKVAISLLRIHTLIYPVVHGFSFLHLASSLRLSLSFVFIVSSRISFVFPYVMMMRSLPSISNQAESLGSHDSPIFDIAHSEAWLRPLVEIRDVGRPLFLEDIEELHNDFSVQFPRLWLDSSIFIDLVLVYTGAYPMHYVYQHFLDAILRHIPSPFELYAPQVHRRLSDIMSGSPIFSTLFSILPDIVFGSPIFSAALWHHVQNPYIFHGSLTLSLNLLYFQRLFGIVTKSPIFFSDSPTSRPDPLSFRQLFGIVFGSTIFSGALQYRDQIPYLFNGFPALCLDPLSFQRLFEIDIVSGSPIFSTTLRHRVRIPYLFNGSPASCRDPLSFVRLSDIVSGSPFFSAHLWHCV